jgi:hypothetical protein
VRVYHLVCANYGLENLTKGRLKVAEFASLNDPFEFLAVDLADRRVRPRFSRLRKKALAGRGLLCFSKSWGSPVLWSHYAERHTGLCLGFDVPDDLGQDVMYLKTRSQLKGLLPAATGGGADLCPLFFLKFEGWKYEDEWRRVVSLDQAIKQDDLCFWSFGKDLQLREVVAGALCRVTRSMLQQSLGNRARNVRLTKARLAFTRFGVVVQRRGFQESRRRRTNSGASAAVSK